MTKQKSILITGAASGIGLETARLFAAKGWLVGAADIAADRVQAVAKELGSNVIPLTADVSVTKQVQAMVKEFTGHTGGTLDVMFNNAGILYMGHHEEIDAKDHHKIIDVNAKGVLDCINAVFPIMKKMPRARIISMSSTSSEYGTPDHAVYSATKFFVRGLSEALNIEWQRFNITVSAILVAYVNTPLLNEAEVQSKAMNILGVKVTPDQVARKVWKAAHGKKVLYRVGVDAAFLNISVRLLGSWARPIFKRLTGY